jgi:hypothetical protein
MYNQQTVLSTVMASKSVDINVVVIGKLKIAFFSLIRSAYSATGTSLTARFVSTYI